MSKNKFLDLENQYTWIERRKALLPAIEVVGFVLVFIMKYIVRKQYLDRLIGLKNTPDIKIITGIRRSGKSELMKAYIRYILDNEPSANIIYVDFFNLDFEDLKDYKKLHSYIKARRIDEITNYVFIDEVQLCPQFELAVNSLHNSGDFDIYITGSNAFLLSSDLATLFTGRFIEIPIYPFSFSEFCTYYSDEQDIEHLLERYSYQGGLAGSYIYGKEQDRITYLKDVYNTIVKRDLVDKYRIVDLTVLNHLTEFLMDNISNLTSPNKISSLITANIIPANHNTIGKYIKYLCNAFFFYNVRRYDIKGKKYLESTNKYYLCDLGFRYAILGNRNLDFGRIYENMVCIELFRRGYEVYVGKLYQKEIDFVAIKGNEKIYIQVSDNITESTTFNREITPLLQIKDAYPKMLIARTRHPEYQYEGIKIINITEWLLDVKSKIKV
ncbi:MAG: ATP-binding protein [Phascolarctobacterium sp.]|nr:ATP-binding protein [Phascolarctobacterium sp.]